MRRWPGLAPSPSGHFPTCVVPVSSLWVHVAQTALIVAFIFDPRQKKFAKVEQTHVFFSPWTARQWAVIPGEFQGTLRRWAFALTLAGCLQCPFISAPWPSLFLFAKNCNLSRFF